MGVYGLWRLLDASGKPVPLETLEGKVLAIDVSIWIHQVLQGYQDRHGQSKPNAHLLGLFHRICKLLHFKIKPVFVFDGGIPMLKRNTIAARRKQKSIATSKAQKMKTDLITNLIKHSAVKSALNSDGVNAKNNPTQVVSSIPSKPSANDMFILPSLPSSSQIDLSDSEDSDSSAHVSPRKQTKWMGNIHSVDVSTSEFKALPADVRYDILTDLKETRKQNSWGRLHEMPESSNHFSGFQMKRLLKRRFVQESLESAEKEMGGKSLTLEELEKLLTEQGISTKDRDAAFRIAADNTTRLIYISDKNALPRSNSENSEKKLTENEAEKEIEPVPGPSKLQSIAEDINEYELNDEWDSDIELLSTDDSIPVIGNTSQYNESSDYESETEMNESRPISKKYFGKNAMNPALTYMMEYSGLTQHQILQLLQQNKSENNLSKPKQSQGESSFDMIDFEQKIKSEPAEVANAEIVNHSDKSIDSIATEPKTIVRENSDNNIITENISTNSHSFDIEEEVPNHPVEDTRTKTPEKPEKNDSSSESGSDDFIEIPDVPVPEASFRNESIVKPKMQITIKADEHPEDDLFADVFGSQKDVSTPPSSTLSKTESVIDKSIISATTSPSIIDIEDEILSTIDIEKVVSMSEETTKLTETVAENRKVDSVTTAAEMETNSVKEDAKIANQSAAEKVTAAKDAEKLELWIKEARDSKPAPPAMTEEELISLQSQLEDEQEDLTANIGKLERQATGISDQIQIEAQELLRLFGIPYIVAPMEAEAQCAFLEQIKLTDGTITDDSDIWLFGGRCVYKNFFNNNKRVLRFRSSDIQHHFKLTRREMIQLALLVGSDYTQGVPGIGPVTALEILAAFPTEGDNLLNGLTYFSSWVKSGKPPGPGKTTLRNKLKSVQIEKGFPSQAVVQAYLFPTVDESRETFTWGRPNMVLLADYTRQKFGWTRLKFEEQMKLVLKRLDEKKSQKVIELYFALQESPKSIEPSLSKRVQKAVKRLNHESESDNEQSKEKPKKRGRGKAKSSKTEVVESSTCEESKEVPKEDSESQHTITSSNVNANEFIPQREKDKADALQRKLRAIEVIRKSKQGLNKTKKVKRCVRKVKKEAELSESDSS